MFLCHYRIRKGDIEAAFAQADVIVEGEYHTPAQEHAFLQPEAGVGYIDEEGRVTVYGGWAVGARRPGTDCALRWICRSSRCGSSIRRLAALLVGEKICRCKLSWRWLSGGLHQRGIDRPVKIIWSREESIIGHHKRHPYTSTRDGVLPQEGKILAAEVDCDADGGAYAYTSTKVLGNATLMCTGPYEIPNVNVDSYAVYTNNIPNGAFRGFGGPQGAFAAEMQMNKLAEALGIDPVEIRMRNLLQEGSLLSVGTPLPKGVSIDTGGGKMRRCCWMDQNEHRRLEKTGH